MTFSPPAHLADLAVVIGYLGLILVIGMRARRVKTEEGFFLAGRKLGRTLQFFLNFGNASDANGAVSTASVVYQQGVPGIWISFQTIFMNPYYWFMSTWFRRARLVTTGDLFEDRFGSRELGAVYALFQIGVAILLIGFGDFVSYKVTAVLLNNAVGPVPFYLVYTVVVAAYIVTGGLAAAAVNQALQGVLIVMFSVLLIPFGLHAAGGWHALARSIPAEMLDLFGSAHSQFTGWAVVAIVLVSLIQVHSVMTQMTIFGSAKDEYAARFGFASGTYAKRVMIIFWAVAGLIAICLFRGASHLPDPDAVWGIMSLRLLGPGLLGLMVAGLLAANMASLAAQAVTVAGLFVRNLYGQVWPGHTQGQAVRAGQWAIVAVLVLSLGAAAVMNDLKSVMFLILYGNVAFGAAVYLIFHWSRLTSGAVWLCVVLTMLSTLVIPFAVQWIPALRSRPSLTRVSTPIEPTASRTAIFFESVEPAAVASEVPPAVGHGRFNFELYLLGKIGVVRPEGLSPGGRLAAQFFYDGIFPFAVLILASYVTPRTDPERVRRFYGKLKTPVGKTPELDREAMAATELNPDRFDHTKLFAASSWQFCRWDREDTWGFFACCAVSGAILGGFWLLLRSLA